MQKPHLGELVFFWVLFGIAGFLTLMILSPYGTAIFLAGVLSIVFIPTFERLLRLFRGNRSLASLATVAFILVMFIVPLSLIGFLMFEEMLSVYASLNESNVGLQVINVWIDNFEALVKNIVPTFHIEADVYGYIEGGLRWLADHLNDFFSQVFAILLDTFIVIIAMFFFLRDGKKLKEFAVKWSPLADSYDESIIAKLEVAVSSVVKGALGTAAAQGLLVGVGLMLFGVPNPVLWGVVSTIAALVPLFGTTIVTVPAVLFLFISGHSVAAIGLLLWSLIFVGLIDNILRPLLIKRDVHVHSFLILMSVLGGLVYFGPIGFLSGPIVLAFFFALLDVYPDIMKGRKITRDSSDII